MSAATVLDARALPREVHDLIMDKALPLLAETVSILDPFHANAIQLRTRKLLSLLKEIRWMD